MSLEANKFLGRLYGEAIADQQRQKEVIKRIEGLNKDKMGIMPDLDLSIQDYNFFRRLLNNVAGDIYQIQSAFAEDIDDQIAEAVSNLISKWNFLVTALAKIKYKELKFSDKTRVYNDIKEVRPSLSQISNKLIAKAAADDKFEGLKTRIDTIISQIDSDRFDQVSYPLSEQVELLEDPPAP
jgi:hypothetical protein